MAAKLARRQAHHSDRLAARLKAPQSSPGVSGSSQVGWGILGP